MRGIDPTAKPNEGIWKSTQNAVLGGMSMGLTGGLVTGLAGGWAFGVAFGLASGSIFSLSSPAGEAAIRHVVLRWRLWREGLTPKPWRYVPFLEAMTDHLLLDRIGGAYKFKHDLLQKHVVQLDDSFIAALDHEAKRGSAA